MIELYWLARHATEETERVFKEAPAPTTTDTSYFKVDPDLHQRILGVLTTAAKIRGLITERPRNKSRQSKVQHEFLVRRVRWLSSLLNGLTVEGIGAAKVRHSLEHFDEFLDDAARLCLSGALARPTFLPVDMAVGNRKAVEQFGHAAVYNLRVYIADERVFVNCGHEISLGRLHDECAAIQDRLAGVLDPDLTKEGGRGSSSIVLTDTSFG